MKISRKQAREMFLRDIDKEIKEHGEDAIAMMAPKPGKNTWTWKELKDAVLSDTELEGGGGNPIDDVLALERYYNKMGKSLADKINNE